MEQPIVVRFRWTADELLRAYQYHFRHVSRPAYRFAANFIVALNIWIGFWLVRGGDSIRYVALGIALMALGVYWFFFRRLERRWMIRRAFRKRPDRDVEFEWQLAPDKIRTQSSLGSSEFGWPSFTKMVRTPSGVLLYPVNEIFHWLPRSGFTSEAEFERCIELARSGIERQYEVA
jgi:hypothetical protein